MKERIVIDEDKIKIEEKDWGVADAEHCKIEQIPETFDELKELCKSITNTRVGLNEEFIIIKMDKGYKIELWKNGNVYYYIHKMANKRTPQQMWVIIKNLVEEQ